MKTILLLSLCFAAFSVEAESAQTETTAPKPVRQVTDMDLQNLTACARLQMQSLTPDQMSVVAQAIKHAEADIEAIRKANAVPVEVKK